MKPSIHNFPVIDVVVYARNPIHYNIYRTAADSSHSATVNLSNEDHRNVLPACETNVDALNFSSMNIHELTTTAPHTSQSNVDEETKNDAAVLGNIKEKGKILTTVIFSPFYFLLHVAQFRSAFRNKKSYIVWKRGNAGTHYWL